jgi:hypothetical protein
MDWGANGGCTLSKGDEFVLGKTSVAFKGNVGKIQYIVSFCQF